MGMPLLLLSFGYKTNCWTDNGAVGEVRRVHKDLSPEDHECKHVDTALFMGAQAQNFWNHFTLYNLHFLFYFLIRLTVFYRSLCSYDGQNYKKRPRLE